MPEFLKKRLLRWEAFLLVLLAAEIAVFGHLNPRFLRIPVLLGSINDFMSICVISLFVTLVLVTGGMDIQAGSIVGLASIVVGLLWKDFGVNVWAASLLALAIGAACGALSGFFVAYTGVQAMVVTLGGSFLYSGLALAATQLSDTESYKGISGFPRAFTAFSKYRLFGMIPSQTLIFLALIAVSYVILHKTRYGRCVFLCGVNQSAAEYSGINSRLVIMSAYIFSGASAALAGVVLTSYLGTAKADFGKELTLPIITAVVLGGTSNLGGRGGVIGTALAALVIGVMRFGLSMSGISTQYLDIPVGALLVLAVACRTFMDNPDISRRVRRLFARRKA
ncbi:MAG: ABC transporter permease [Planctomycetota bacterium]|jgi:AI-2 transport system permease protein|nr:ABC transporter permease [Planctomycetota bacterium]